MQLCMCRFDCMSFRLLEFKVKFTVPFNLYFEYNSFYTMCIVHSYIHLTKIPIFFCLFCSFVWVCWWTNSILMSLHASSGNLKYSNCIRQCGFRLWRLHVCVCGLLHAEIESAAPFSNCFNILFYCTFHIHQLFYACYTQIAIARNCFQSFPALGI